MLGDMITTIKEYVSEYPEIDFNTAVFHTQCYGINYSLTCQLVGAQLGLADNSHIRVDTKHLFKWIERNRTN